MADINDIFAKRDAGIRERRFSRTRRMLLSDAWGAGATPTIRVLPESIAEDAEAGDVVGTLSVQNGIGSYSFSITVDPDSKFELDGDSLKLADTLDYETATSHLVTIEADNGVGDPITQQLSIAVVDVEE